MKTSKLYDVIVVGELNVDIIFRLILAADKHACQMNEMKK